MKKFELPSPLNKVDALIRKNNEAYNRLIEEYELLEAQERTEMPQVDRVELWRKKQKNFDKRKELEQEHRCILEKNPL